MKNLCEKSVVRATKKCRWNDKFMLLERHTESHLTL